jgi:uncharacterized membrane protein
VLLVRYLGDGARRPAHTSPEQSTPQRFLVERFAHGDIDEEEYRSRLNILAGQSKP